jgi:hypothetical protein
MDCKKIHDYIIQKALNENRVYDSRIHHKHHITPLHEDVKSTEIVILSHKEHRIVHLLRSRFCSKAKNYIAYKLLSKHDLDVCSDAGKIGGSITKNKNLGIFSEHHDRSVETKRRHDSGIMSVPWLKLDRKNAVQAGNACVLSKKGIYSAEWDRSKTSKENWKNQDPAQKLRRIEQLQTNSSQAGKIAFEKRAGFHSLSEIEKKNNASKGGKSHIGKRWMNNGDEIKRVPGILVDSYIADGWKIGWKRNI